MFLNDFNRYSVAAATCGLAPPMLLGVVTLGAGCTSAPRPQTARPCLAKRGCPTNQTLKQCRPAVTTGARSLTAALANAPQSLDQTLSVRSQLQRHARSCTRKGCLNNTCCNRCEERLVLRATSQPDRRLTQTLSLRGGTGGGGVSHRQLTCVGDDSKTCCAIAPGQEVVVTGKLSQSGSTTHGPLYTLDVVEICRP